MRQLIKQVNGCWCQVDIQEPVWQSAEDWQTGRALRLAVDAEPEQAWIGASIIGIDFPAFVDGRGLSLAVLLRQRLNYTGELRAVGAIHEDTLHFLARCGFTSFELPDDCDLETALSLITPHRRYYQGSVVAPEPVFRR